MRLRGWLMSCKPKASEKTNCGSQGMPVIIWAQPHPHGQLLDDNRLALGQLTTREVLRRSTFGE